MPLSTATRERIERARNRYPMPRSAALPALWAVQDELGYLEPAALVEVATLLGIAASEVEATATFYSMYFRRPPGRHHLLVCTNAACALRGADGIADHIERRLGVPSGGTTADGAFTWERTVECLGGCGRAPAMQVDHHFADDLTAESVDALLERLRREPAHGHAAPPGDAADLHHVKPVETGTPQSAAAETGASPAAVARGEALPAPGTGPPLGRHQPGESPDQAARPSRGTGAARPRRRRERRPRPSADDL